MSEHCVSCGAEIPEGRQVCIICESAKTPRAWIPDTGTSCVQRFRCPYCLGAVYWPQNHGKERPPRPVCFYPLCPWCGKMIKVTDD